MNIEVSGKVRFISSKEEVLGEKEKHFFKIIVIETLQDSYIAIHVWDDKLKKIKGLKLNSIVEFECRLESHKNRKRKDLWFHKLLLQ
jgi:hypothetical protein|tara:strand:+ start:2097 stop:2357 length:261 start_codon:yes stop_codon:yes gene_type:complete